MYDSEANSGPGPSTKGVRNQNSAVKELLISPGSMKRNTKAEDDHHSRLGEHAAVLWKFHKITDTTVKLHGVQYPAHKTVLSCYSRYFKDMLLKASGNIAVINLQLESVSNSAFSCLLQYMYTGDLDLTCQNIGDVYTAARKLGMDTAIEHCAKILKGKERRDVHCVYVYVTAKKLQLREDAKRALQSMCKRFEKVVGTNEFLDLTHEQVVEYLSSDRLATRSEVIVYLSALKWLSYRYLDREQHAVSVVSCVRFPMMNLNEVLACHSPPLLPGIVEVPEIKAKLLKATCFIASKTINEEKRFKRYDCDERTYLLEREAIILWDPSIFDPKRYAVYQEEVAASTIQSGFRNYQHRRASQTDQRAQQQGPSSSDEDRESSESSDDEVSLEMAGQREEDEDEEDEEEEEEEDEGRRRGIVDRFRKSVTSLFRSRGVEDNTSEDEEPSPRPKKNRRPYGGRRTDSPPSSPEGPRWKPPPEATTILQDLERSGDSSGKQKTGHDEEDDDPNDEENEEASREVEELAESDPREEDSYGAIVVSGGFDGENADHPDSGKMLLLYEPGAGKWTKIAEMYKPRHHHRVVYLEGFLYVIGGCDPERTKKKEKMSPLNSCHSFDLSTREWKKISKMRHCRVYHATAVVNGKIYVVGGKDENDCMLSSVEVYDPSSDSWSELYDSLGASSIGAGACSRGGRLWVVGGMTRDPQEGRITLSSKVDCYDPELEEWCGDVPSLPSPLAFPSAAVCGNRVYVVGGCTMPHSTADDLLSTEQVLYYDTAKEAWAHATPLPSPRHFVGAAAVYKSLFVLGGLTTSKKESIDEVLLLDERSKEWTVASRLPSQLCGVSVTSVPKSFAQPPTEEEE